MNKPLFDFTLIKKQKYKALSSVALLYILSTVPNGIAGPLEKAKTVGSRDDSQPYISVELLTKTKTLNADGSITVGVRFTPHKHWHIYWLNPGDTGLSPEITWKLPPGYTAKTIDWPYPHSIPVAHLTNYGYESEVLLSTTITAGKDADIEQALDIDADLSWLVCEEACVPGESSLSLTVAGHKEIDAKPRLAIPSSTPTHTPLNAKSLFTHWNNKVPKVSKSIGSNVDINTKQKTLSFELYAQGLLFENADSVEVFVKNLDVTRYGKPLSINWHNNFLKWEQALSEFYASPPSSLDIVLVIDGKKSHEFSLSI